MIRGSKRVGRPEARPPADMLRSVIEECLPAVLARAREEGKLGDWIKMIELYRKIAPDEQSQKEFWDNLEKIRHDVLKDKKKRSRKRGKAGKSDATRN